MEYATSYELLQDWLPNVRTFQGAQKTYRFLGHISETMRGEEKVMGMLSVAYEIIFNLVPDPTQ